MPGWRNWQTHTTQNRTRKLMGVRLSPRAHKTPDPRLGHLPVSDGRLARPAFQDGGFVVLELELGKGAGKTKVFPWRRQRAIASVGTAGFQRAS